MPVLLLCGGDADAKNKLRRAIEARYGRTPPAIEHLQLSFDGRARVKVGPIKTWVPVEATARFVFPTQLRWDFVVKPLKLPVQRGIEAFDGSTYRTQRGNNPPEVIAAEYAEAARKRLWAIAALLLTPLSDHYIEVLNIDEKTIEARNTKLGDSVAISLSDAGAMESAQVMALNPDTQRQQILTLRVTETHKTVMGLILPEKIMAYWDGEEYFEVVPTQADLEPEFAETVFTLQATATGSLA